MTLLRNRIDGSLPEGDLAVLGRLGVFRVGGGPQALIAQAAAVVAALAVMFGTLYYSVDAAEDSLEVIGHGSGPQVVATTELYYALSDADSQVATVLLTGGSGTELADTALGRYEQRQSDVTSALLKANRLAGSAEAQRSTIESIMSRWGEYQQLAAVALLLAERAEYAAGDPPPDVLSAYQEATALMSGQILPRAYNLTLANATIVRESYDAASGPIAFGLAAVAVTGLAALAFLTALQVYLARVFRRVFSPSLVVATAVAVLYLFTGLAVLDTEHDALAEAKGGFDATLSVERGQAISNSLHADRLRLLLDEDDADVYEQTYFDKAQQLVYIEVGSLPRYQEALAEGNLGEEPTGLVWDALDGSPEADRVFAAYTALIGADAEMRESGGDPSARLVPVDAARAEYEQALGALSDRHFDHFGSAVEDGEHAVAGFAFLLIAAMVSLGVFTFSGIAPRLREYR